MQHWESSAGSRLDSGGVPAEKNPGRLHPAPSGATGDPALFPMSSPRNRPVVLLAEDSEDDAFFFRWTLKKSELECDLIHVSDGQQALALLKGCAAPDGTRNAKCPDLVFLDLKMPALTGFEVLEWIQAHPFSPPLDVAVLSGSEHAIDIERATSLGASAYFVKPIAAEHLRARFAAWQQKAAGATPRADLAQRA